MNKPHWWRRAVLRRAAFGAAVAALRTVVFVILLAAPLSLLPFGLMLVYLDTQWGIVVTAMALLLILIGRYIYRMLSEGFSVRSLARIEAQGHTVKSLPSSSVRPLLGLDDGGRVWTAAVALGGLGLLAVNGYGLVPLYRWVEPYRLALHAHHIIGLLCMPLLTVYLYRSARRISGSWKLGLVFGFLPFFWGIAALRTPTPLIITFAAEVVLLPLFLLLALIRTVAVENRKDAFVWFMAAFLVLATAGTGTFGASDPNHLRFSFRHREFHRFFAWFLLFNLALTSYYFYATRRRGAFFSFAFLATGNIAAFGLAAGMYYAHDAYRDRIRTASDERSTYASPIYAMSKIAAPARTLPSPEPMLGSEECKDCHQLTFKQWAASTHAQATRNQAFQKVVQTLAAEHGTQFLTPCATCHEPAIALAGRIDLLIDPAYVARSEGINCRSCHLMVHGGSKNGLYQMAIPRGEQAFEHGERRSFKIQAVLEHAEDYTRPMLLSGASCFPCHSLRSYRKGKQLVPYDNVVSFVASHAARELDIKCHDCHMPRTERDDFHYSWKDHRFFGSNIVLDATSGITDPVAAAEITAFTESTRDFMFGMISPIEPTSETVAALAARVPFLNDAQRADLRMLIEMGPEILDATVKTYRIENWAEIVSHMLRVEKLTRGGQSFRACVTQAALESGGSALRLAVELTNGHIGHDFPAPLFTNITRVWTETVLTGDDGQEVFRKGYDMYDYSNQLGRIEITDSGHAVEPLETLQYMQIIGNRFVAPDKGLVEERSLPLPTGAVWPLTLNYKLQYLRYDDRQMRWMTGDPAARMEPMTLLEMSAAIPDPATQPMTSPNCGTHRRHTPLRQTVTAFPTVYDSFRPFGLFFPAEEGSYHY